jgi:RNA polymerase sigma factor (sigma-70 family)
METEATAASARRTSENELLLAVARGETDALRRLYRAFERPLYSLGMRWLDDPKLAEELVQEVTLRIWRRAHSFDPERGAAASWIFGVARNVASDLARERMRDPIPLAEPRADGAEPWDEDAAWQGWQVAKVLQSMPTDQRTLLELAYIRQFTHSEIARATGIPLGTVKTRLYQALRKLREMLIESGIVEEP